MVDGVLGQRSAEFKEMLELLPPGAFDGTIELVAPDDIHAAERVCAELRRLHPH